MTDTIDQTSYIARDKLLEDIKNMPNHLEWFRGIAVLNGNNGDSILINVKEMNETVNSLPKKFHGFDIRIDVVGDIYAF